MSQISSFVEIIGREKLKELREAAAPEGKKRLWLSKYCDDDQLAELYYRIFERHDDLAELARVARDLWGIQPHWNLKSFVAGLKTWRKRLATDIDAVAITQKDPTDKQKVMELRKRQRALTAKLDALGRLGYAIELQTERMAMGHEIELRAKTPMKFMDTVMDTLNKMVENYITLAIKTGAMNAAPSEININLKEKSDFVLTHIIGDDGPSMLKVADKFLTKLKEAAVTMVWDEETQRYYPPKVLAALREKKQLEETSQILETNDREETYNPQ